MNGSKSFDTLVASLSQTVDDNPAQLALLSEVKETISQWRQLVVEPQIALRRQIGTARTLDEIVSSSSKVTDLVAEIAAASNEQADGIGQVNIGITQIDQVTQQNTANAEEGASAAEQLSSQSERLREMMNQFQIKNMIRNTGQVSASAALPPASQPQIQAPRQPDR